MTPRYTMRNITLHYKCRNGMYPKSENILRTYVPDDKVFWDTVWTEYRPVKYTSKAIINQCWADPEPHENGFQPTWNAVDGAVDRRSHLGRYSIHEGLPMNPIGRTGLIGRGCLGRWGPNHAADPIVTRWKRNEFNEVCKEQVSQKPILQFVAVARKDSGEWAIPGGMVDPGEEVSTTLKREFMEEALNSFSATSHQKLQWEKLLDEFFKRGVEIYRGYVDDPRNTDNAWMETAATNFHDEQNKYVGCLKLSAGDDAIGVKWMDISSDINLYANHIQFIQAVAEKRKSFW